MTPFADEGQLIESLGKGDPVSLKVIYRLHWKKLYNIAYHIMHDNADAEDIVQDVFISLWQRREKLRIATNLEHYLVKAAKYTAFRYLKMNAARQRMVNMPVREPLAVNNTEAAVFRKEREAMLKTLLATLPLKTRQIFSLSRFQGLTYPEIASEMGVSVKTVEYHISKALRKLSGGPGFF